MPAWPDAERPTEEAVEERAHVLEAARRGDTAPAVAARHHADWRVRSTAFTVLAAAGELDDATATAAVADPAPGARRTAARLAARHDTVALEPLLADDDSTVVEMACWAAGERAAGGERHMAALTSIGQDHDDALCREAAVAALGAIGHPDGLATILGGTTDKPTVRRRAVLALAAFDGPEVDAAIDRALTDRDWQVRQAAEDIGGSVP